MSKWPLALALLSACTPTVLDFGKDSCGSTGGCFKFEADKAFVTAGHTLSLRLADDADNYAFEIEPAGAGAVTDGAFVTTETTGPVKITARERKSPSRFAQLSLNVVSPPSPATLAFAKAIVTTGRTYTVAVLKERDGIVNTWTVNNARIVTAATGDEVQVEIGGIGTAVIVTTARNEAGDEAPPTATSLAVVGEPPAGLELDVPATLTAHKSGVLARVVNAPEGVDFEWKYEQAGVVTTLAPQTPVITFDVPEVGSLFLSARAINAAGEASTDQASAVIEVVEPGLSIVVGWRGGEGTANGSGGDARFLNATSLVHMSDGYTYVADMNAYVIREVAPDGTTRDAIGSRVARTSATTTDGDGDGLSARLGEVRALAKQDDDHFFALENPLGNECRIRKMTRTGSTWAVTTVYNDDCAVCSATAYHDPYAIAARPDGRLWVSGSNDNSSKSGVIYEIDTSSYNAGITPIAGDCGADAGHVDGPNATATFIDLAGITWDETANLGYVIDCDDGEDCLIRSISTGGGGAVETPIDINASVGLSVGEAPVDLKHIGSSFYVSFDSRVARFDPPATTGPFTATILAGADWSFYGYYEPYYLISPFEQTPVGVDAGFGYVSALVEGTQNDLWLSDDAHGEVRRLVDYRVGANQGVVEHISGRGTASAEATYGPTSVVNARAIRFSRAVQRNGTLWFGTTHSFSINTDFWLGQIDEITGATYTWRAGSDDPYNPSAPASTFRNLALGPIEDVAARADGSLIVMNTQTYLDDPDIFTLWHLTNAGIAVREAEFTVAALPAVSMATDSNDWIYVGAGSVGFTQTARLYVFIEGNQLLLANFYTVSLGVVDNHGVAYDPELVPTAIASDGKGIVYTTNHGEGDSTGDFDGGVLRTDVGTGEITRFAGFGPSCDPFSPSNINTDRPCLEACFSRPDGIALAPNGDIFVADLQVVHRIRRTGNDCRVDTITQHTLESGVALGQAPRFNHAQHLTVTPSGDLWVTDANEPGIYLLRF